MIEVGCGFSSRVTARVNREIFGGEMRFTCIDPVIRTPIQKEVEGITEIRQEEVQDTPLELFEELDAGDILFIDTSHAVKTGGDVPWIYNQILPRMKPGVFVHLHDAFLPGDYPEEWVMEGRAWNEVYLLQSFLAFNSGFEVVFGVRWMMQNHRAALEDAFGDLGPHSDLSGVALDPPRVMQMRAAVLEEFGAPLQVQEVGLDAPRAGEVLVRLEACGVCHTDLYTASGADPSGYAPTVLGHEGAGVVEQVGPGRRPGAARRPRRDAFLAAVRRVHSLPQPQDQPLPGDPRAAEPRLPARRDHPAVARR